jgi:hypothetical protein
MINRRFFTDLDNPDHLDYSEKCYLTSVSFNSHNAHYYFLCTACLFCMSRKHVYLQLSLLYLLHMNSNILRKTLC